MKHKLLQKLFTAIWAFLLSFSLSAAATMSIVTAFSLGVDTELLLRTCAQAAAICSLCYILPLSLVPLGGGAALLGYLWQQGILESTAEAFLNRLSRQYDRAYGWGIIRWGYRTADQMEPDIVFALCILGAVIALLTAWSVCRRKTAFLPLAAALCTFSTCFVVNDTVPDTLWLYLLLLSFLMLIMTGYVRKQDEAQGNRLCLWLAPVTALALLCLFAAVPREDYDRQDTAKQIVDSLLKSDSVQLLLGHIDEGNAVGTTTIVGGVDLRSVGYRLESQAQVLQITAPHTGTLYLRSRALDTYDGISWSSSGMDYSQYQWPTDVLEPVGEVTVSTRFAHRMLYVPYYTDTLQTLNLNLGMENSKSLTEYSFSLRQLTQPGLFAQIYPTETTDVPASYQPLLDKYNAEHPGNAKVDNWAKPLVNKLLGDMHSPYHKAQAIASYVRNSATYNTRTARMPSAKKDFAQWFLEESNSGYCVHFATAATVLLQAAGLPARYVTGYYANVTQGEQVTVYSNQSHAWAEYWLPGYGWTVLEATPPDFSAEPEETTQATEGTEPTADSTPTRPAETIPSTTQPTTPQATETNRDWVLWVLLGITGICGLVTAAEGQRKLRRHLRQKKLDAATPNQKALLYWRDAVVYARLLQKMPDSHLYALAERAKFSHHTLTDAQLQQFETYATASVASLHNHNIFRRFYYRFILAIY